MDELFSQGVPEGFQRLDIRNGFALAFGPVHARRQGERVSMGFHVGAHHLDASGACHPGAFATFADLQLAGLYRTGVVPGGHSPTINLSLEYIAPARLGDWIEFDVALIDRARSLIFTQAVLRGPAGPVARTTALYSAPLPAHTSVPPPHAQADAPAVEISPPPGFRALPAAPGYEADFGPVFAREEGGVANLGFRVVDKHINIHGAVHGGALATFAAARAPNEGGIVSLSIDYLAPARLGDWVESRIETVKATRRFVFSQAIVSTERGPIARASAIHARA